MVRVHSVARSGRTIPIVVAVLLVGVAAVLAVPSTRQRVMSALGSEPKEIGSGYILRKAEKGPFRIMITENGTIDSLRNVVLSNRVEGSTTIISLIPEGTKVNSPVVGELDGVVQFVDTASQSAKSLKVVADDGTEKQYEITLGQYTTLLVTDRQKVRKGDLLAGDICCELDSSTLVEKEKEQQIKTTTAVANVEKAIKDIEIQETTNASNMAKAQNVVELAVLDKNKYEAEGGVYQQELETIQGDLKQKEEELSINQEDYERIRDQARLGYANVNQLESARLKVTQTNILLGVKRGELNVKEKYEKERTLKDLELKLSEAQNEVKRTKLEGDATLTQFKAALDAAKLTLAIEQEKLELFQRQIRACKLVATQAGEVVYAAQNSGRGSEPVVIEEGASVRERQAIINLPDLEHMKIDARIHESRISRVMVGQPVEIEIDAIPGDPYRGKLQSISSVPVPGSWPNTDLKEYEAVIEILDDPARMRKLKPGMTAQVRIIVDDRKENVLQIPVQSVVSFSGKFFCYVPTKAGADRRELTVGDANDEFMEILEGVKEGESVVMSPRTHFSKELSEIEAKLSAELEKNRVRVETPDRKAGGTPGGAGEDSGPAGGKGRREGRGPGEGSGPGGNGGGPGGGGPGGAGPGGGGGPGGGRPGGFQMPTDAKSMHEGMDKNKDGVVTKDEHPFPQGFDRSDTDGDGKITMEESEANFKRMQERMGKQQ